MRVCIKLQAAVPVAEYKSTGNETFARFFFLAKFPAEVYKLLSKLAWLGEGGEGGRQGMPTCWQSK